MDISEYPLTFKTPHLKCSVIVLLITTKMTLKTRKNSVNASSMMACSASKIDFRHWPEGSKLHSLACKNDIIIFAKYDRAFRATADKNITERQWVQREIDS